MYQAVIATQPVVVFLTPGAALGKARPAVGAARS